MSELDLLCQAIQTQDTVESGDVKFLYMDENTIYRFQNNKMKPISKTLMNKAKKYIQQQQQKPAKAKKTKQPPKRKIVETEEEENEVLSYAKEDNEIEEVEQIEQPESVENEVLSYAKQKPMKKTKLNKPKQPKKEVVMNEFQNPYNISLDEYYNNKNRMEFMTREMERMNNKITKLKQYKTLINKLTGGGEIDDLPTQPQQQQFQNVSYRQQQQNGVNDSLFI